MTKNLFFDTENDTFGGVKLIEMRLLMPFIIAFLSLKTVGQQEYSGSLTESKIYEVYGISFFDGRPEIMQAMITLLENRIRYEILTSSESEKYPKLSSVGLMTKYNSTLIADSVFDKKTFNPLKYDIPFFTKERFVFKIDDTDFVLIIEPSD